jgi:dTDP-4-amino-4,6-dideoxygalactose transaminase
MAVAAPVTIVPADPRANYLAHQAEIDTAVLGVLGRGAYILGPEVAAFEREFGAYLGGRPVVGVGSGTEALHLALRACGIGPGDAVLTVSHTAVATVAAIELAGAAAVLVDIDPATYTMSPAALEEALGRLRREGAPGRPRALIPVHLYGQPADMPALLDLARRHDLLVIEDCAQAHGAALAGRPAGAWGDAAAFSFYPTKNLGALGDGGAVAAATPDLADRLRALREYGWRERYVSELPRGMNSRLDEVQAAILRVKLRHLDADNRRRHELAALYDSLLAGGGLTLPRPGRAVTHVYHQYVVGAPRRDELREHLRARGVGTLIHYPVPVHLQPAYAGRVAVPVPLRHTEHACRHILSLPMYPELSEGQGRTVAEHILAMGRGD